jgi:hypothetical protein
MTKQYDPIFRKCTAYQARNLLYFLSLLKGHSVEARDFQPKGCGLHLTLKIPSWFTYCFSSDLSVCLSVRLHTGALRLIVQSWLDRSNFRYQMSPCVSPCKSTQRWKAKLRARNFTRRHKYISSNHSFVSVRFHTLYYILLWKYLFCLHHSESFYFLSAACIVSFFWSTAH